MVFMIGGGVFQFLSKLLLDYNKKENRGYFSFFFNKKCLHDFTNGVLHLNRVKNVLNGFLLTIEIFKMTGESCFLLVQIGGEVQSNTQKLKQRPRERASQQVQGRAPSQPSHGCLPSGPSPTFPFNNGHTLPLHVRMVPNVPLSISPFSRPPPHLNLYCTCTYFYIEK